MPDEKIVCDINDLAQLAPVSIMCFNCQGVITFVNDWHIHNFARDRRGKEYFLGKSIFDLPGIKSSGLATKFEDVFTGEGFLAENVYTSEFSGGQAGYQSVRAIPVEKDGKLLGGIVIREDVTRYILSERSLVDRERKIQALLNATSDSAILFDLAGRFLALNGEAARRRGGTVEALHGRSIYDGLPERCRAPRRARVDEAIESRAVVNFEERQNGSIYAVSVYPILNDSGEVSELASYSRDITEQAAREAELVKAKTAAESATVVKSQFLANISHELRTPLNGIMGLAQVALAGELPDELKESFELIRESSERLTMVINNLLDLADIESGAIEPIAREFDLHGLLESVTASFTVQARLKGLDLRLHVHPDVPPRLVGDEFRIRQVLVCLLSNAIKCTSVGHVALSAGPAADGGPKNGRDAAGRLGVELVFSVVDTGVGIGADDLGTIFESFSLAENVLTKQRSGAGVGLAIAKSLVHLMGGEIEASSCPGCGSRFAFRIGCPLPVPRPRAAALPTQSATAEPKGAGRVLLVEDEAVNRIMTRHLLRQLGYDAVEAENGQQALRLLTSERVDMVLMDIQMPVMDGIEATQHIRNGEVPGLDRNIPIIALTAYARASDRSRFLQIGMDEFMAKPFELAHLARVMERVATCRAAGLDRSECVS
jgi:PAS domain S-box-containing protein